MKNLMEKSNPLYMDASDAILNAIKRGDIAKDDKLPSENVLAKMLSISRPTLRNALQVLQNEGILEKRQGRETIVNRPCLDLKLRIDQPLGFYTLIKNSGQSPTIKKQEYKLINIDKSISDRLKIEKDSSCYFLEKLYAGDGEPIIYSRDYVPSSNLHEIPSEKKVRATVMDLFKLSKDFLIQPIAYSVLEIGSTRETKAIKELLNSKSRETFVHLEETHYTKNNTIAAFSEIILRDSALKIQVVRKIY